MNSFSNVIFLTQGRGFELFFDLSKVFHAMKPLHQVGFYISDHHFFDQLCAQKPEYKKWDSTTVKEWELVEGAKRLQKPDIAKLRQYEKDLGRPNFWDALIADRRISWGAGYAYDLDYQSRYSHDEMLAILQVGLERMERLFDEVKPDVVINLQCVTLGDYLGYLIARKRNIKFINLRPTRIRNLMFAADNLHEPSASIEKKYHEYKEGGIPAPLKQQAEEFLKSVRQTSAMYEGVVPVSNKPPVLKKVKRNFFATLKNIFNILHSEWQYQFGRYRHDSHAASVIKGLFYTRLKNPWRARKMNRILDRHYVRKADLGTFPFAFYPLHAEPEVTLLVYSNTYMNQIEVIRLFSRNLPVGTKLIVKEHPWTIGKRPVSYYSELLKIPNVLIADPTLKSKDLIDHAEIITVLAGTIAFEAMIYRKPTVLLGGAPFGFLPKSMIRHVKEPLRLGQEIRELMAHYTHDENALLSYIAAVMSESAPIDFYTRLLKRPNGFNPNLVGDERQQDEERQKQLIELAKYILKQGTFGTPRIVHESSSHHRDVSLC